VFLSCLSAPCNSQSLVFILLQFTGKLSYHDVMLCTIPAIAQVTVRLAFSMRPNRVSLSPHLRTEADPVSETLCFSGISLLLLFSV
jgi:hypothetical protein